MRWLRRLLAFLLLASVGLVAGAILEPAVRPARMAATRHPVPIARKGITKEMSESLSTALVELAPFQPERRPAPPFTGSQGAPAAGGPAVPRPVLTLTAIAWGRIPAAVVEGLPGVEGARVVIAGDTVGGLRVRVIRRDLVVIAAPDTVWVLRFGGPLP